MEKTAKRRSSGLKRAKDELVKCTSLQPLLIHIESDEGCKAHFSREKKSCQHEPECRSPQGEPRNNPATIYFTLVLC